jgi:hypothetical protein
MYFREKMIPNLKRFDMFDVRKVHESKKIRKNQDSYSAELKLK